MIILIVVGELTAFSELLLMNDDTQTEVFHVSTFSRNTHGPNQLYCMAGDRFPAKMLSVLSQQQQQYAIVIIIICPIAIYSISHGTDYKIGLSVSSVSVSVSVCLSVRLRALSRSHFLIDFHQNWHRRKYPQKEERVR